MLTNPDPFWCFWTYHHVHGPPVHLPLNPSMTQTHPNHSSHPCISFNVLSSCPWMVQTTPITLGQTLIGSHQSLTGTLGHPSLPIVFWASANTQWASRHPPPSTRPINGLRPNIGFHQTPTLFLLIVIISHCLIPSNPVLTILVHTLDSPLSHPHCPQLLALVYK